jgi:MscS family membrane protein
VEHIGLRSIRIRTPDRTVVTIPNGQIAGATLETISARDKFWFHPDVRLRYDTTPAQLRRVLDGCRRLLAAHPSVMREDQRVRFHRVAPYSFDVEIVAYVMARDWNEFLQIQEQLLFGVTELVDRSGSALALPFQTTYLAAREQQESTTTAAHKRLGPAR